MYSTFQVRISATCFPSWCAKHARLSIPLREHAHAQSAGQKQWSPPPFSCRGNQLGVAGWKEVADALEHIPSLTSLNGCTDYEAIRKGGVKKMELEETELGLWAARFFERSAKTLTMLDVR
jgi:hypothetical protein